MAQITYTDKVALNTNSDIPDYNKVTASDMNEIKTVVNTNYTECKKQDSGWVNIDYQNTYSSYDNNYNPFQYRKIDNQVFIRGMIKSTTSNPSGYYATAGTLPSSAYPLKDVYFLANNNGSGITVNIRNDGGIRIFNTSTSWIALDGINFFVD